VWVVYAAGFTCIIRIHLITHSHTHTHSLYISLSVSIQHTHTHTHTVVIIVNNPTVTRTVDKKNTVTEHLEDELDDRVLSAFLKYARVCMWECVCVCGSVYVYMGVCSVYVYVGVCMDDRVMSAFLKCARECMCAL
jgi:hypothetical protein